MQVWGEGGGVELLSSQQNAAVWRQRTAAPTADLNQELQQAVTYRRQTFTPRQHAADQLCTSRFPVSQPRSFIAVVSDTAEYVDQHSASAQSIGSEEMIDSRYCTVYSKELEYAT